MLSYIQGTIIQGTTTETGLKVKAFLLDRQYQKGVKVSDQQMGALNLERAETCPQWNYPIKPRIAYASQ